VTQLQIVVFRDAVISNTNSRCLCSRSVGARKISLKKSLFAAKITVHAGNDKRPRHTIKQSRCPRTHTQRENRWPRCSTVELKSQRSRKIQPEKKTKTNEQAFIETRRQCNCTAFLFQRVDANNRTMPNTTTAGATRAKNERKGSETFSIFQGCIFVRAAVGERSRVHSIRGVARNRPA
jgi:hypothetical protein